MNRIATHRRSRPTIVRGAAGVALLLGALLSSAAQAQSRDDAKSLLKAMSDYIASQNNISLAYDADIDVTTADRQRLQLNGSGQLQIVRPDKVHVRRTAGYTNVEVAFDGTTLPFYTKYLNSFAQSPFSVSISQAVDRLTGVYFVEAPIADLLLSGAYSKFAGNIIDAKKVGREVVDGVECDHLAFRGTDVDWQVWIEIGVRPIPRKYVVTSKAVTGWPQYTLHISDWKTDATVAADVPTFE
jgi:hypothetical protein